MRGRDAPYLPATTNDGEPRYAPGEAALAKRRLEHVAKAIWSAEWEEPFPREGTIQHALEMQKAVAATEALAQAMEMGGAHHNEGANPDNAPKGDPAPQRFNP